MRMDIENGPASYSFISQRLKLNYVDWGNVDAPTLILVHGGRDHARSWDWVARALRDEWHVVAPDMRGHGDSSWSPDGAYAMPYLVADLAQLVRQFGDGPVTMVAHSLGGAVALRYAGLFPERLSRIAAIEGIGMAPPSWNAPVHERWRNFIENLPALSARQPRRYATFEEALARMREENKHLREDYARHLTIHGMIRNEDGTLSWKFDNYLRSHFPVEIDNEEQRELWRRITCPVWLSHGADSWAKHPREEGRADEFRDVRVTSYDHAGHWLHHDRFDDFIADLRAFLRG
jgi:pimeloyl-ACP methyl ester carboxylesterase